jgi:predicted permease
MVAGMGKKEEHGFFKKSLATAVKSPVIWSIIIGLILSISGIGAFAGTKAYATIKDILDFISRPTPVLICLVIGSGLKFSFVRMKTESVTALLKIALSVVFAIIIALVVMNPLELSLGLKTALFSMFVLPGPFIIPVFMDSSDRSEVEYVSNTLSIGTLLGLLGFILVSFI